MSMPFAISVKDLSKRFANKLVVNKVNLEVPTGSVFGFLGPNGSGKTTCIRMICGLLEPTAGLGRCLEFDIRQDRESIKREVGYMTQRFSLYEDLKVRENLLFVARIFGMERPGIAVDSAMQRFGLTGFSNQLAGTLSGGWKQRLSLAAAMIHKPRLLLLDEPTAGVDPKARREFWQEIHELSLSGLTVLVTTHYMDEAERCSDLAYIVKGEILTRGTPESLVGQSGLNTYMVEGPQLFALAEKLKGQPGVEQIAAFGSRLHISGPDKETLEATLTRFCDADHRYLRVDTSLEDVFIHLMGKEKR